MPKSSHNAKILELARRGADSRLQELQAEIASLIRAFPHLRVRRGRGAGQAAIPGERRPRRRRLSADARERIRQAQLRRWAKYKAAKKK